MTRGGPIETNGAADWRALWEEVAAKTRDKLREYDAAGIVPTASDTAAVSMRVAERLFKEAGAVAADADIERAQTIGEQVWRDAYPDAPQDAAADFTDFIRADGIVTRPVTWLWRGYLAAGALNIVDGLPGIGKSLLYLDIAARLTRGDSMPDGTPCETGAAGACIVTLEDDPSTTIVPRLIAAGADVSRVVFLPTVKGTDSNGDPIPVPWSTPRDIGTLPKMRALGVRLLVIDPLFGHITGDTYKDSEVRAALGPLAAAAAECGIAVLLIRHLTKNSAGKPAMYGGGGSVGIIGAARVGMIAGNDPTQEGRAVLAVTKCNVARRARSMSYSMEVGHAADIPRIVWHGHSELSADEVFHAAMAPPGALLPRDEAGAFLTDCLHDSAMLSGEFYQRAEEAGFSERTMKRAAKDLTESVKLGGPGSPWAIKLKGYTIDLDERNALLERNKILSQASEQTFPF